MELLQNAKLPGQRIDASVGKHFFSGCSSLLNKFVQLQPEKCYCFWQTAHTI
ncbi:hypothetical protein Cfor_00523, partial [Coptotermes formosanus]